MSRRTGALLVAAAWLLVTGCGKDNGKVNTLAAGDTVKAQEPKRQEPAAPSCDLLGSALASADGWVQVKRGKDEFIAKSVTVSPALVTILKGRDSSFDPAMNCVQVLKRKTSDTTFESKLEIAPEACGKDGVIGEERNGVITLKIGKLIASHGAVAAAPAKEKEKTEKVEKQKAEECVSSTYELLHAAKGGDLAVGELQVNRVTKMIPGPQPQQPAQSQQGKVAEKPTQIAQVTYEFVLAKLVDFVMARGHLDTFQKPAPEKPKGEQNQQPTRVESQKPAPQKPEKPVVPQKPEPEKPAPKPIRT